MLTKSLFFTRTSYLSVSAPFHSKTLLFDAPDIILSDLPHISTEKWELSFPVYSTLDGSDLRTKRDSLLAELLSLQCRDPLVWQSAVRTALPEHSVTHVSIRTLPKIEL